MLIEPKQTYEKPEAFNKNNIIYWSEHYKKLNCPEGQARQIEARKFIEKDCIKWDKELNCFICKPIEGYNKNTYRLTKKGTKFECSCQFYSKTGKICSHVLALFMMLKIWRSQK